MVDTTTQVRNWIFTAAALLVFAAAVFLRVGSLDARVMHGDEAVNSVKFAQLADLDRNIYAGVPYRYDPHEFHGPALPYLTLPVKWATGATTYAETGEAFYRWVTVVCGLGVVVITLLLGRFIGWPTAIAAALLVALSPAMVFFSRYYIHEMPLVLFTACGIYFGMAYFHGGKWSDAARCGACVGLMHTTKETFVLSLFAISVAAGVVWLMERRSKPLALSTLFKPMHMVGAVIAMLVVSAALFTQFGANPRGIVDSVLTYKSWLAIGTKGGVGAGDVHNHPFGFYLERLFWHPFRSTIHITEMLVGLLALVGLVVSLCGCGISERARPSARFVAIYGFVLLLVYCVIPYKTPWSILSAYHALILTAGVGAVAIVRLTLGLTSGTSGSGATHRRSGRCVSAGNNDESAHTAADGDVWHPSRMRIGVAIVVALALLGASLHLAKQNRIVNNVYHTDPRNPWVYAHPHSDVRKLSRWVTTIAQLDGSEPLRIGVDLDYVWPLPFYLRDPQIVSEYYDWQMVLNEDDAIHIGDNSGLIENVYKAHHSEVTMHRPNFPLYVYIRKDLWEAYLKSQEGE